MTCVPFQYKVNSGFILYRDLLYLLPRMSLKNIELLVVWPCVAETLKKSQLVYLFFFFF